MLGTKIAFNHIIPKESQAMEISTFLRISLLSLIPTLAIAAPASDMKTKTDASSSTVEQIKGSQVLNKGQKISYAIGASMGENLKQQDITVNMDFFLQGFKDAMIQNKPALTQDEMRQVLSSFQEEQHKKFEEKMKAAAVKNLNEGKAFLDANKTKSGVITLASGLQYKVNTPGAGESPQKTDSVTVNYRGTLINGTEFDSSEKHGQAATFPVNAVISGWTEALQLMKPGAKWTLYIPPNLAYGEAGAGRLIEPNATLIFDVDLLSVNHPKDADKVPEQDKKGAQ
jgi:FKBP-type peptidyl-prolyl cis-trans isomerase FklB